MTDGEHGQDSHTSEELHACTDISTKALHVALHMVPETLPKQCVPHSESDVMSMCGGRSFTFCGRRFIFPRVSERHYRIVPLCALS